VVAVVAAADGVPEPRLEIAPKLQMTADVKREINGQSSMTIIVDTVVADHPIDRTTIRCTLKQEMHKLSNRATNV
jgi:hypothetical protein